MSFFLWFATWKAMFYLSSKLWLNVLALCADALTTASCWYAKTQLWHSNAISLKWSEDTHLDSSHSKVSFHQCILRCYRWEKIQHCSSIQPKILCVIDLSTVFNKCFNSSSTNMEFELRNINKLKNWLSTIYEKTLLCLRKTLIHIQAQAEEEKICIAPDLVQ